MIKERLSYRLDGENGKKIMNLNTLYKMIKIEKGNLSHAKEMEMKFPDIVNPQVVEITEKSLNSLINDYKMSGGKRNV